MNLHLESCGAGSPLLLIHGWGMHGGLWGGMVEQLAQHHQVFRIDLPGHGFSAPMPDFTLACLVQRLSASFDMPIAICGWSLGGQIALHWALQQPQQVSRLVLLATTPCFVQRPDWQHALAQEALQDFADAVLHNREQTLRRFLALQVRGSENERELLATLRAQLFSRGAPDLGTLRGGLAILRDTDLRPQLPLVRQPALVLAGERDLLTPVAASRYMVEAMPDAKLFTVTGAAHAPFLSHGAVVVKQITEYLHG